MFSTKVLQLNNMPDQKSVALILFAYGSEIRQFVYSGFVDELNSHYRVVVAARIVTENLKRLSKQHGFELRELVHSEPNDLQRYFFGKADAVFARAYHTKKKFSYYGNSGEQRMPVKYPGFYRWLLPFVNWIEKVSFALVRAQEVDRFLSDINPAVIIVNLPRSPYLLRPLFQSKRLGACNVLVFNTLKEVDANGRMNIPVDLYLTWNAESSAELLRYNPQIDRQDVHAAGSPYYDRSFPQEVGGCNKHLLYCAANPKSLPNEVAFVERLFINLNSAGLLDGKTFVVRPNPMDDNFSRWNGLAQRTGINVEVPKWIWQPENNWNEALQEDVDNYSRLLGEAKFVMGSASTVAIDAVMLGKPFICIADNFWPDEIDGCDFRYFAEAENFRPVRQSRAVLCAENFDEMVRFMQREGGRFSPDDMPAVVYDAKRTAGQRIVEKLLRGKVPCKIPAD